MLGPISILICWIYILHFPPTFIIVAFSRTDEYNTNFHKEHNNEEHKRIELAVKMTF